jgi:hypothetical protein
MILLLPEHRAALRANTLARAEVCRLRKAEPSNETRGSFDPAPVVKFFNPCGAATWLATELDEDDDTLFGLADLGFGCPELGSFSLREIASVRLPFGLTIERDIGFDGMMPLSVWAEAARATQSISSAEMLIREIAANPRPELPSD